MREINKHHNIRTRRLLSESVQLEEELIPVFVRPTLWLIGVFLVGFVIWASITPIKEVAKGIGEVLPSDKVKVVQHLDGGIVSEILVEERQTVNKGDLLFRFDGTQVEAELQQMQARHATLLLREERLSAFTENRKLNISLLEGDAYADQVISQADTFHKQIETKASGLSIIDSQIQQKRKHLLQIEHSITSAQKDLKLTSELATMREELAEKKLINRSMLLEARRAKVAAEGEVHKLQQEYAVAQQELNEIIQKQEDAGNQIQRDAFKELSEIRAEKAEVERVLDKQRSIVSRLAVHAQTQGLVQDLQIHTIGQVVPSGGLLMKLVPFDTLLEVEVKVEPKDIAFLQIGQTVKMRVSSYDYTRFGYAMGHLKRISAFSMADEKDPKQQRFFKAWIALDQPFIGNDPQRNLLQPGMAVEAEIITGEKKLIAYLLKPVADIFSKSFGER